MSVPMIRRAFLLALLALAAPTQAQSVKLQAHEIEALLSGNTAVGKWQGVPYRQYFDADGTTIYAQENTRSTVGKWRIDPERDEYQSIWPRDAEWEGWFVMEFGGDFFWVSKSTPPTPFRVLEGQQLVAETAIDLACSSIADWARGKDSDVRKLVLAPHPAECGTSLGMSGSVAQHCAWAFPYRGAEARQQFSKFVDRLTACYGDSKPTAAPLVNHPDSYELESFHVQGATVSTSLKDKGALQQTYIFLRAERGAD